MEIRRLTKNDLDGFFANRLRGLQNSPSAFLTTYEEEKARGYAHFAVTLAHEGSEKAIFGAIEESGSVVVGTIGIFQETRLKISHKAMIWGMYVDVSHRGQGVGSQLLDLALEFAADVMKVEVVGLSVEAANQNARKLYESRGFKVWGVEPQAMKAHGEFFDELHMSLKLRS